MGVSREEQVFAGAVDRGPDPSPAHRQPRRGFTREIGRENRDAAQTRHRAQMDSAAARMIDDPEPIGGEAHQRRSDERRDERDAECQGEGDQHGAQVRGMDEEGRVRLAPRSKSAPKRSFHTNTIASRTIAPLIFEAPWVRSVKMIGISRRRNPARHALKFISI